LINREQNFVQVRRDLDFIVQKIMNPGAIFAQGFCQHRQNLAEVHADFFNRSGMAQNVGLGIFGSVINT
jgi:hypothetical protein